MEILVSSLYYAPHFAARPEMIILLPKAAFNNLVALFCSELSSLTVEPVIPNLKRAHRTSFHPASYTLGLLGCYIRHDYSCFDQHT